MKKLSVLFVALMAVVLFTTSCDSVPGKAPSLSSDKDSVSYFIGVNIGENMKSFPGGLEVDKFIAGLRQAMAADSSVLTMDQMQLQMFIQQYVASAEKKEAEANKLASDKFLEENKKKDGVQVTASGLQYKVINEGTGARPDSASVVKVHYKGTLADGTEFDSSYKRNEPASFRVDQVIPGWGEGIQLMPVGSKYMFYIPSELGYGERGGGGQIKGNMALVFEVELLEIEQPADTVQQPQ